MENRSKELMIAACIGIGSFVLGFVTAKLTCGRKKLECDCDTRICCEDECVGDCENCEYAGDCSCVN